MPRLSPSRFARGLPIPDEKLVEVMALGLARDDPFENIRQIGLRIDAIELGGLCRPSNYAERIRYGASL